MPWPLANEAAGVAEAVSSLWHWPSLSLETQIPDVIRHTALRSSDFPPPKHRNAPAATAQLPCYSHSTAIGTLFMSLLPNSHPDLDAAHKHCFLNRSELTRSEVCGCFYCFAIFSPAEIQEWIDDDQTAICPKCPVDAVIGSASGYPIDMAFLRQMYDKWF